MLPPEPAVIIQAILEAYGADWRDNPAALAGRIVRALDDVGFEIVQKGTDE